MRLNKIVLVFLVLAGSLFITPIKAEELPVIDIVQLADGRVKVSSNDEAVIGGFVSLNLTNETTEKILLKSDGIKEGECLLFPDPGLSGELSYVFLYSESEEEIALSGIVTPVFNEKEEETVDSTSSLFAEPTLKTPWFSSEWGLSGKFTFWVVCEDYDAEFEILYSTKKNGKYKKLNQFGYYTENYTDPISGEINGWSECHGYFNNAKANKKYYLKARSYKTISGKVVYSEWVTHTTKLFTGPVKNIVAKLESANKLSVQWSKVKKAAKYGFYVNGYETGTKALYETWISDGKDPDIFDWEMYEETIGEGRTTKRSRNFTLNNIDMNLPIEVFIYSLDKKGRFGQDYTLVIDDEFCRPVQITDYKADPTGKNVVFTFKSPLDVTKYDMKRRDFGGNFGTVQDNSIRKSQSDPLSMKKNASRYDLSLDRMVIDPDMKECLYDFNLFVATKENGTYKRVKTIADFSDPNNLKLIYKAKRGKKLYYKIMPTIEAIYWNSYNYPELHDKANVSYYVNLMEKADAINFKLPK